MGLLDDAIREHLELKRLRGADPTEVARAEDEALSPVPRDRGGAAAADLEAGDVVVANGDSAGVPAGFDATHEAHAPDVPQSPAPADLHIAGQSGEEVSAGEISHVGQETAEIDMASVMGAEGESARASGQEGAENTTAHVASSPDETELPELEPEREAPAATADAADAEKRASGEDGQPGADEESAEPVEDVLEETPDFLQDTPEQERLWFEQQPPRDFDFDK